MDHTTLSPRGKSLWLNAAEMKRGEIAVAQTPTIDMLGKEGPETFCLSFWYLAYGNGLTRVLLLR